MNKLELIDIIIEIFQVNYSRILIYSYLKNKNFDVKNGYIFGVDYLVSDNKNIHSKFLVKFLSIKKELEQDQIIRLTRIAANSNKKLLLIYYTRQ